MKAEKQELVAKSQCFLFVAGRQIDGDVRPQPLLPHLLSQTAAFQSSVLKKAPSRYQLRTKDCIGCRVKFTARSNFASKNWKSFGVTVVENLDDLCPFIA